MKKKPKMAGKTRWSRTAHARLEYRCIDEADLGHAKMLRVDSNPP